MCVLRAASFFVQVHENGWAYELLMVEGMTPLTAGWATPDVALEYDVMKTDLGWMLVLRDGPVTLTQVFDSAPAAEAEAQAIALLLTPVGSRPH
jgi:hypothetical protein